MAGEDQMQKEGMRRKAAAGEGGVYQPRETEERRKGGGWLSWQRQRGAGREAQANPSR